MSECVRGCERACERGCVSGYERGCVGSEGVSEDVNEGVSGQRACQRACHLLDTMGHGLDGEGWPVQKTLEGLDNRVGQDYLRERRRGVGRHF